jgi:hypothetical protein
MKHSQFISAILLALTTVGVQAAALVTIVTDTSLSADNHLLDGEDITVTNCTLTIAGTHVFDSLSLINGATLTHEPATAGQPDNRIDLEIETDVLIDPSSSINVSLKGYGHGFPGPGAGVTGPPGNDWGSGGAHGGDGADGSSGAKGGRAYDSVSEPTDYGSAGGACPSHGGLERRGGGAVHITALGTIIVHGSIVANGDSDAVTGSDYEVGGGAGGSIWLAGALGLAGIGVIQANGGGGDQDGDSGGGGGGRIAIYGASGLFSGLIQARSSKCSFPGGAGTIYTSDILQTEASVLVDNGGLSGVGTGLAYSQPLRLTAANGGIAAALTALNLVGLEVGSNCALTVAYPGTLLDVYVQGDAHVAQGGSISADGKGYTAGTNQGPGTAPTFLDYAGGGSYGGEGGVGWSSAPIGPVYGSITQPQDFGSAGGTGGTNWSANGDPGSAGGGAIQLNITGTLGLNGSISANGISDIPGHGGCGSGGSIWLTVGTLQGSGSISANGGTGQYNCVGGSGGGGRVAIYYTNAPGVSFADQVFALGGGPSVCPAREWGGAGTIYFQQASQPGNLLVENGGLSGGVTPVTIPQTCRWLTVLSNAVVNVSTAGATLTGLHVGTNAVLSGDSTLEITVQGDAEIDAGGAISLDGKGFPLGSNKGPGAAPDFSGYAGGGSYGGQGGAGWSGAPVGASYGSVLQPSDLGSAGGAGNGAPGSAGGGALRLTVTGMLLINGALSVNGGSGTPDYGGCGSGGSIWVNTGTLQGSGSISANGGTGRADCDGGAGGGGRIALYYNDASFNCATQAVARGGGPFNCPSRLWGGAGTVYFRGAADPVGTLLIDNGGNVGAQTPITSPEAFNLTISGGATASASRGLTVTTLLVATNSTLTDLPGDPSLDVLVLGSAVLDPGSRMSVNACGYPVGANRGPGTAPVNADWGGGAGYGGPGGHGWGGTAGGIVYGSATQPIDLGSAGGISGGDIGTPGGGAIRFSVAGALLHSGTISANGGSNPPRSGGCGSGGSIWLTTAFLSGGGLISAAGGTGLSDCDGGSGGGGRIAIYSGYLSGFDIATQVSAPSGGPPNCPTLLGGTGTVYTAALASMPALGVISSTPNGGAPRPWADCIDLVFNMAVDPTSFTAQDVTVTTPLGLLPPGLLTLTNLGGTGWRISFPTQTANGSYQYTVGPVITNLFGTRMSDAYVGGFTVNQNAAANRIACNAQNSTAQLSIQSAAGFNYQLVSSGDLVNWQAVSPVTPGDDSVLVWSVSTTNAPQAFFRIQITDAP